MKRKLLLYCFLYGLVLVLSNLTNASLLQAQPDVAASVIGSFNQP